MDQMKGQGFPRNLQDDGQREQKRNKLLSRAVGKVLLVPFLLFVSMMIGLLIGYSVIGKKPVSEVFDWNTYKHMYDLIFAGS
jgi:hypothetical protein